MIGKNVGIFLAAASIAMTFFFFILVSRFLVKRFLSFCLYHQTPSSAVQEKPQDRKPCIKKPSYLTSPINVKSSGSATIPIYLSKLRGPGGFTLNFRVFSPPSFEREIPKVDMYGAINFVRTGNVRTFVPTGSRRLLVINYREMSLAMYAPKRVKETTKPNRKLLNGNSLLFSKQSPDHNGGINISTRKKMDRGVGFDVQEHGEDDPWDTRQFNPEPTFCHTLREVVSVVAAPPRHGGIIKITSCSGARPTALRSSGRGLLKKKYANEELDQQGQSGRTSTEFAKKYCQGVDDCLVFSTPEDRQEEFIFQTPCEAAEFQYIIMLLRAAGKEIFYLYETLEVIGKLFSKVPEDQSRMENVVSSGVMVDDAWQCLREIPMLRKGLYQFRLFSQFDEVNGIELNDNEITISKRQLNRQSLGPVDFFSLFSPPLPMKQSIPVPCPTPCAKHEYQWYLTRGGIGCHYFYLYSVSTLLRRVRKASLYISAYVWMRKIISRSEVLRKLCSCKVVSCKPTSKNAAEKM